jgi:predicted PurR-regulated permease PerM
MPDPTPNTKTDRPLPAWARLHLWQIQPVRDVLVGLAIVALFWFGQKTSIVTVPLLLAILLAYLFEPVIRWLMRRAGMSRRGSVIAILAGLVLLVVLPSVAGLTYGVVQGVGFAGRVVDNVEQVVGSLDTKLSDDDREKRRSELSTPYRFVRDKIDEARQDDSDLGAALEGIVAWIRANAEKIAQTTATGALGAARSVAGFVGGLFALGFMGFVTAFFFFFVASDWPKLNVFGARMLPDKHRGTTLKLLRRFDEVVSAFIRGRLTIAFFQSIVFSLGYFFIGVPAAFILGPAVAILSIVPYLALVGVPVSVALLWLENHAGVRGAWWWVIGAPVVIYMLGQALDDYVFTPLVQGKQTGLDTPVILFASLAGGALFGVFGLLIAIPLAACVKIVLQELVWPKFKQWAEGRAADPLPIKNG